MGRRFPVLDGSAGPFVALLEEAGICDQRRDRRLLSIRREVTVRDGGKLARIFPAKRLTVECSIDFDHPLIPNTPLSFRILGASLRTGDLQRANLWVLAGCGGSSAGGTGQGWLPGQCDCDRSLPCAQSGGSAVCG